MQRTVADVMTSEFIYVRSDTKLTRVLQLMVEHRFRSVPVIDTDNRLAGMISREDVMSRVAGAERHDHLVNGRPRRPAVRAGKRPQFALTRSSSSGAIR